VIEPPVHPLLSARGVAHGFLLRDAQPPASLLRPRQVHGDRVAQPNGRGGLSPIEADAVVSLEPGLPVAVVTADCVPVLACSEEGAAVAAIHAGWRGLACGVVARALEALRRAAGAGARLSAVVGPHIGACCYEVDAPVLDALGARFGRALAGATAASRPGHARVALGSLVRGELLGAGVEAECLGDFGALCTRCDARRFHSFRRDGALAGRMTHYIAAAHSRNPDANEG